MLTITVQDAGARALLRRIQQVGGNLGPLLVSVGEAMHARVDGHFASQAGPDGVPWTPNAPATKRAKGGRPILTDSGRLRRQIVQQVSGNTLTLAATMQYAAIQQFGGRIERAAYSKLVRHRTNAKGELLRSKIMGGQGLIFAKDSHKRARTRWFEVGAHSITIPARPFLPVTAAGELYPGERSAIVAQIEAYIAQLAAGGVQA